MGDRPARELKVAVMQPYFLPYIGYFQLISSVDEFVVYDNIKYTKKGWINRNRMLLNGHDAVFSLALRQDSDSKAIVERELAPGFDRSGLLNQFRGAYARAPYFADTMALLERVVLHPAANLFDYLHHSIRCVCEHLSIPTRVTVSSQVDIDHALRSQDRVIAICRALGATTYVNAIGGTTLYSREAFAGNGLSLRFLRSRSFEYRQFGAPFVPWLSIVDVLMFNSPDVVRGLVSGHYELCE